MKKFKNIIIIFLGLIILFSCLNSIQAQDINVIDNATFNLENTSIKTYSDLYDKINSSEDASTLNLTNSYRFELSRDNESFVGGAVISKNITLIGNNNFIDGNFMASGLNITSNCNVVLKNINFINGYSEKSSGSIIVGKNSNILIDNCTFISNKVHNSNGGAIYGLEGTNIEIYNCEFYNNTAERVSNLSWNEFKSGMGSAICMRIGSNLRLHNSIFRNNVGYVTTILIITWDDINTNQSSLYVDNCLFENNTAWSNGAIYLDEFGIAEIKNSVFKHNNSTKLGGTVVFDASTKAIVRNCSFEDNSAVEGGGIYINTFDPQYNSDVEIFDSNFINNTVIKSGGAIFSTRATTKVCRCNFINNGADFYGGGIYSNFGSINVSECEFFGNSGYYGGGLHLKADDNIIFNCVLINNMASYSGGGIYSNRGFVKIIGSEFKSNSGQYGGALALKVNNTLVEKSSFVNNHGLKNGGAIYSNGKSIRVSYCTFNTNRGEYGGALFLKDMDIIIHNSFFGSNIAFLNGGGIYLKGNFVKVVSCEFESNFANYGGGLLLKSNNVLVEKSLFVKNFASKNGGAIYSNFGSIIISYSNFTKNSALNGGALLLKPKTFNVFKSSFINNLASKKGGAIYSNIEKAYSSKCIFSKNSAFKSSDIYGVYFAKVTKYITSKGVKLKVILTSPWGMPLSQKIKIKLTGYSSKWLKTNSKGVLTFLVPKNYKVSKKSLNIILDEGLGVIKKYIYKNPGKIKIPKKTKNNSKLKVNIKDSQTKKPIKKTIFLVKIYSGKHFKTFSIKTNSNGNFKIDMRKFSKGKHKILIYLNNNKYYINKRLSFIIH